MIKRQRGEDPVTLEQFADDNDLDIINENGDLYFNKIRYRVPVLYVT